MAEQIDIDAVQRYHQQYLDERGGGTQRGGVSAQMDGLAQKNLSNQRIRELEIENARLDAAVAREIEFRERLRPYGPGLSMEDAQEYYGNLISNIGLFVAKWAIPLINNPDIQARFHAAIATNPQLIKEFLDYLRTQQDLHRAALEVPHIDQDILAALITRFIHTNVLGSDSLAGIIPRTLVKALDHFQNVMSKCPSDTGLADNVPVVSWRAHAQNSVIEHPEYSEQRSLTMTVLTTHLAGILQFLNIYEEGEFLADITEQIIGPAFELQEKFLISTENIFHFEHQQHSPFGQWFNGSREQLEDLKCIDSGVFRGRFDVGSLSPEPTIEELQQLIWLICSIHPALIGQSIYEGLEDQVIIAMQRVLIHLSRNHRQPTGGTFLAVILKEMDPDGSRGLSVVLGG
ncbi:uncharacterized protein F4822DRAFT_349003 [Hypoxylon trugodes]|uniref:uncharacterized protein n=1 Tax=Hypoxylon trugodes TaxID=326681 RepID=UPI00218F6DD4|nr:uncharacterized protein F4822DRAFT_349003 [Hypoxylon trugodes]KAI1385604.1 hypothetical protein F4822DRAFT_349003 [Hypoxylon trugodes]